MPTLDDIRADGERKLQKALADSDEQTRRELRDALRRYGSVRAIPESVWESIERRKSEEVIAILYLLMIDSDRWTANELEMQGITRRRLSPRADGGYLGSAGRQAGRMATQATDSLRNRLERTVTDRQLSTERSPVGELDLGDIDQALDEALSKKSREDIADDETTGAMSAGQMGAGRRHEPGAGAGIQIDLVWEIHPEEAISGESCHRCKPLDGTTEEVWGKVFPDGPGEHVHKHCHCRLRPVVRALKESILREGRWITLNGGDGDGQPVYIDDDGNIAKGPDGLEGRNIGDLDNEPKFKVTDTEAFKAWFGDSKVVDEHGEPLVVYHGTTVDQDFTTFKDGWFTQDVDEVGAYATGAYNRRGEAGRTIPVYLKIENPLVANGFSVEKAIAAGYDGAKVRTFNGKTHWVPFFPERQVKSAIGNKGTFNPYSSDIRESA